MTTRLLVFRRVVTWDHVIFEITNLLPIANSIDTPTPSLLNHLERQQIHRLPIPSLSESALSPKIWMKMYWTRVLCIKLGTMWPEPSWCYLCPRYSYHDMNIIDIEWDAWTTTLERQVAVYMIERRSLAERVQNSMILRDVLSRRLAPYSHRQDTWSSKTASIIEQELRDSRRSWISSLDRKDMHDDKRQVRWTWLRDAARSV